MRDSRKLIDLQADTPVEHEFVRLLFKHRVKFEAQPHLLDTMISYSVKDVEDLPLAKHLLYLALHPRETGAIR